jgi:DNA-directed RNA polymerase subunit M/transcription elongation factor TFIIS
MNIKSIDNPVQFRQNIRNKLNKYFDSDKISTNIEIAIYNWSINYAKDKKVVRQWNNYYFILIYINRLKSIYCNLNPDFINKIKNNELKPQDFVFMNHYELNPEKWDTLLDIKKKRDYNKFNPVIKPTITSYQCKRCKSNQLSHYELQTRSADEASTLFFNCLGCGNQWKI